MKSLIRWMALAYLVLGLMACTGSGQGVGFAGADYFAGDSPSYNFGQGQSFENFENVERAQSYLGLFTKERVWRDIKPSKVWSGSTIGLSAYFPLDVRWKLKDGREFMLEQIDLRAIMREYFRNNKILLQHHQENRARAEGDFSPDLLYEVKDDTVIIKWQVVTNKTPLLQRSAPATKALGPGYSYELYFVTAIKGKPTSGIDFDKRWETLK